MVEPIPEAGLIDLSTTKDLTLSLIFFFDFTLLFLTVVISWAPVSSARKPLIWSSLRSAENEKLFWVNGSVVPSDLIREYLLSEYER